MGDYLRVGPIRNQVAVANRATKSFIGFYERTQGFGAQVNNRKFITSELKWSTSAERK